MRSLTKVALLGALGLGVGQLGGCASERDPINRVQANALPKSFFLGQDLKAATDDPTFYARATVTDVGYGAAQDGVFTSTYAQPVSILKWEVSENFLIGRLAYEQIEGTDGKGKRPGLSGKNEGQIAYMYRIESHFDVRRDFNAQTGEESNVVVENTQDRPWFEREQMRVDFSQNLISTAYDLDTLSMMGLYGGVTYSPLSYYVSDPNNFDAPHFEQNQGYFDITNKALATPQLINAFGSQFPACMLPSEFSGGTANGGANCSPSEITIRQSFKRVDVNDYEPYDQDGIQFRAYGAFTEDRKGYSRNYGLTDNNWHRFVSRYDIWARNHYYKDPVKMTGEVACYTDKTPFGADPNRDADNNGTEDECEAVTAATGVEGSKCDKFSQKCTLPYQLREQVPVVWYVTANSSQDYFDGTANATHEWDVAMRVAGQSAKYAECKSFGGADCEKYAVYTGQQDENDDAISLAHDVDACRHSGKAKAECDGVADNLGAQRKLSAGVIAVAKLPEAVVLCHSPVEASDPEVCGEAKSTDANGKVTARARLPKGITSAQCVGLFRNGAKSDKDRETLATCYNSTVVRLGDLRYHVVHNIENPQDPSSWGIMTDAADPLTGRKVAGAMNIWTHINDIWSQGLVDQLRYIKKELKTSDVTEGTNVRDWAAAAQSLRSGGFQTFDKDQLATRIGAAAGMDVKSAADMPKFTAAEIASARDAIRTISEVRGDAAAVSYNRPIYEARRAAAANSQLDARLTTPMMQSYAGFGSAGATAKGGRVEYSGALQKFASPLQMQHPSFARDFERMKQNALAERGACMLNMEAPAPFSVAAMADEMEAKFGKFNEADDAPTKSARAQRMVKYLAQKVHYAVIVHEMGHSIGLRHNFVSSYNSLSYRPQYWQLRTKNGAVKDECTNLSDGAKCVGPRYFDPVTKEESDGLIQMWMQSSTMDYAGEFTQDLIGLGSYDFSAARAFYGNTMSVYADKTTWGAKGPAGRAVMHTQDGFGGILGMRYSTDQAGNQDIHYSQLQKVGQLIKDCAEVDPANFKPTDWNQERDGDFNPTIDGKIVKVDGKYTRCKTQQVDYVPWSTLRAPLSSEAAQYRGGPTVDREGRVRVLNGFATDSWADLGNLSVYRHDNGADPYELMTFFIAQPEVMHIFNNYRRGRNSFSVRGASNRWLVRYNEKMRDGAKGLGLITNIYRSRPGAILDQLRENTLASGMAFDAFTRQMARPQEGGHFQGFDGILRSTADLGEDQASAVLLNVPNGATGYFGNVAWGGAPIENKLANDKGEYSNRYTVNAGSYYQKIWTSMLMTESVDNFISDSRGDFTDPRYRAVSMADLFPEGYRRWLGNNLTGDDFIKGIRVEADGPGGKPKTEAGTRFPASAMGVTSWWKPTPEVCFAKTGTTICSDLTPNATGLENPVANTVVVDPQVSFEQQKFLIAWTMMYLPENQKFFWLDQMNTWEIGRENDPGFANRIELIQPNGKTFIAKTFGKEVIFGKSVQKGIAARVLEYANELMEAAYKTTAVTQNGTTWYKPVLNAEGLPVLKDNTTNCQASTPCRTFEDYMSVINFLRGTQAAFGFAAPEQRGFY
jgi:hypothetical protein